MDKKQRNALIAIGVVLVSLCCCGVGIWPGSSDKAASKSTATTTSARPNSEKAQIFTAVVDSVENDQIRVTAEDDREYVFWLAGVDTGSCSTELGEPFKLRLAALLPVSSTVTVVRTTTAPTSYTRVYLHPGASPAPKRPPAGPSINEQLVAEGSAVLKGLTRGAYSTPAEGQIAAIRAQTEVSIRPYIDAIAAADNAAWEGRVGAVGVCRGRLEVEVAQKEARDRELYGPDGKPGTDDDPKSSYPSTGNGSGGGSSGGGRRCRGRWC
ncbi:hypothetical protein IU485_28135 [Nocardia cyriacigeorgica]|uniref:hypothetical protein n=1 Tax=Nocardia cyriacigeorgica TaxID=135487 RepID=UPI001895053E|nr:hypothetical protein [Nocardia cyriacigeorgica]MBF6085242.1 hypothetical protein [Nocardia cyriacigeorgica]